MIYTPGLMEGIKPNAEYDPDRDEEASLERSRKNREIGEKLLREFGKRERSGQMCQSSLAGACLKRLYLLFFSHCGYPFRSFMC